MSRVLSQHGNVIAADFKKNASLDTAVNFKSETLYCDGSVILTRITALSDDRPILVTHFLGDLATGTIVQLTNG
jgi:hypothetical protein